jgi:hypothetical protein
VISSSKFGEETACEDTDFFVIGFERALCDRSDGARRARDTEDVGHLAYPPQVVDQFHHAAGRLRPAERRRHRRAATSDNTPNGTRGPLGATLPLGAHRVPL